MGLHQLPIYIYREIQLVNRVETEVRAQTSNIDLACYVQLSQYIVAAHICRIPHIRIYHHYRDMMLTSVTATSLPEKMS